MSTIDSNRKPAFIGHPPWARASSRSYATKPSDAAGAALAAPLAGASSRALARADAAWRAACGRISDNAARAAEAAKRFLADETGSFGLPGRAKDGGGAGGGGAGSRISYDRPSGFRKGVRDKVWDNAKNANGCVLDPVSNKVIDKSEPWDMGHKPGYEFRKNKQSAEKRGISRKQFLDEYNNPERYRPELPSSNRSHKGEDKTDDYFGE